MKICLIRPSAPELINDRIDPPLGILILGTIIKECGHDVEILDFAGGKKINIPFAELYGISLYTTSYPDAIRIRDQIRNKSDSPICVGGPHASALPKETLKDFDYVIVGEAEYDFPLILNQLANRSIKQRILFMNSPKNLDKLPYPDYSLIDISTYNRIVDGKKAFSILVSRGCKYKCKYCITANLSSTLRIRSTDHVMGELYNLNNLYGVNALRFIDDNFLISKNFFKAFATELKKFSKPYRIYCRADDLSTEICKILAESGCKMVGCGIESGSQKMHQIMNTQKNVNKMMKGINNAKKYGLKVRAGIIVGFPGETWDTVKESVEILMKMPIDSYNLFNFVPLPGTEPYSKPKEYKIKWLSSNWKDYYMLQGENQASYAFEHEKLSIEELHKMRNYMIEKLNTKFLPSIDDHDNK